MCVCWWCAMNFYLQYMESIDEYALGFNKVEQPLMFRSRAEAMCFCIDYADGEDFKLIDVDDNNWQSLYDSGAFDYEPDL